MVGFLLSLLAAATLASGKVAAFDTRVGLADIKPAIYRFIVDKGGYAAKPIAAALTKGGVPATPPEGFVAKERNGPVKDGEVVRAAAWAAHLSVG